MLISDQKKFIFVHIEKTAGSSITDALKPYSIVRPEAKWYSILRACNLPRDYRRYKFPTHCALREAQKMMPTHKYEQYFKFAFVRNPWDRLVSEYNAACNINRTRRHKRIIVMHDFSEYVDYEIKRNKLLQLRKTLDCRGEIGLNYIGRFENLYEDFTHICDKIDIEVTLKKINAFQHPQYREYYNNQTRSKVCEHWAKDIEAFGYEF